MILQPGDDPGRAFAFIREALDGGRAVHITAREPTPVTVHWRQGELLSVTGAGECSVCGAVTTDGSARCARHPVLDRVHLPRASLDRVERQHLSALARLAAGGVSLDARGATTSQRDALDRLVSYGLAARSSHANRWYTTTEQGQAYARAIGLLTE